jgi:hypothetical protein
MARAGHSGTVVGSAVVVREKYYWPELQLNLWTIMMLTTAGTILGINAQFMGIQERMGLGTPWYVWIRALLPLPSHVPTALVNKQNDQTEQSRANPRPPGSCRMA